jgi:hypothetical protein
VPILFGPSCSRTFKPLLHVGAFVRHDHDRPWLQAGCQKLQPLLESGGPGQAQNVRGHAFIVIAGGASDDFGGNVLGVGAITVRPSRHGSPPALLDRLKGEGIADKELSALLARDQLVPIVHKTAYEALREVSPLLGSRTGLSTAENTMTNVAAKLAELLAPL